MGLRLALELKDNLKDSKVVASGFELLPISDEAARAFGLPRQFVGKGSDDRVQNALHKITGRVSDEFYLCDPVIGSSVKNVPNPWHLFKDSGREASQVLLERRAVGARLISTTGQTDVAATTSVSNSGDVDQPEQEQSLTYSEEVTDERSSETSWAFSLTNSLEVKVGGEYAGFSAEATRSISFTVEHSKTTGRSHSVTKGHAITLTAKAKNPAHTKTPISITLGKGNLVVEVDYEYRLHGKCLAAYIQKSYNGSLTAPDIEINHLLEVMGLPTVVKDKETLTMGFVTDGQINIGQPEPYKK